MAGKLNPDSISGQVRAAMKTAMANDTPRRSIAEWAEEYGIRKNQIHRLGVEVGYRFIRQMKPTPEFVSVGARGSSRGPIPVMTVPSSALVRCKYRPFSRARLVEADEKTGRIVIERV